MRGLEYRSRYIKGRPSSESVLEKAVLKVLRDKGALCYKFVSPSKRGVPDDIVLLNGGKAVFVEFKSPVGNHPVTKLQQARIDEIKALGFDVFVVKTLADADIFIDYCIEAAIYD